MRLLLSTALVALFVCLTVGCQEKVVMPTRTYDPPTMKDVGTLGGSDQPQ